MILLSTPEAIASALVLMAIGFLAGLWCGRDLIPWLVDHDLFPLVHRR